VAQTLNESSRYSRSKVRLYHYTQLLSGLVVISALCALFFIQSGIAAVVAIAGLVVLLVAIQFQSEHSSYRDQFRRIRSQIGRAAPGLVSYDTDVDTLSDVEECQPLQTPSSQISERVLNGAPSSNQNLAASNSAHPSSTPAAKTLPAVANAMQLLTPAPNPT
jgi:hypothetical protein